MSLDDERRWEATLAGRADERKSGSDPSDISAAIGDPAIPLALTMRSRKHRAAAESFEPMPSRLANVDPSIDPTADQVRALRDAGPDGPVVMLNLLKFREQANYPADSPHPACSGVEAYRRYQTAFVETVGDVSRAEVVWEGKIDTTFIGEADEDWDKCLLVRYPSRQNFLAMMADPAYREALVHRYAGLERTLLLQMRGTDGFA